MKTFVAVDSSRKQFSSRGAQITYEIELPTAWFDFKWARLATGRFVPIALIIIIAVFAFRRCSNEYLCFGSTIESVYK